MILVVVTLIPETAQMCYRSRFPHLRKNEPPPTSRGSGSVIFSDKKSAPLHHP
jgi:hypothetical protein